MAQPLGVAYRLGKFQKLTQNQLSVADQRVIYANVFADLGGVYINVYYLGRTFQREGRFYGSVAHPGAYEEEGVAVVYRAVGGLYAVSTEHTVK